MMIAVRNEIWFIAQLEEKKKSILLPFVYCWYCWYCYYCCDRDERERLCVVALRLSRRGRMLWCSPPRLIYMTLRDTCQHNSPWLTSRHNPTEFLTDIDWCSVQSDKAKMFVSERFSSGQPRLKTERPQLSSTRLTSWLKISSPQ